MSAQRPVKLRDGARDPLRGLSDEWVTRRAQDVLEHGLWRHGLRGILPFLGPAFIAAVAYVDPGNYATNIQAGAQYGYLLLWVVLASNIMAMLIQSLSAKLGIATSQSLPELMREHLRRPWSKYVYWIQAEVMAIATDVAEFLGAALAFQLLAGIPLLWGAGLTMLISFGLLGLQRYGFRPLEAAITVLITVIGVCYLLEIILSGPFAPNLLHGAFVPSFDGIGSVVLAAGILGATVMPHVIYLHSSLTQDRIHARGDDQKRVLLRLTLVDVFLAMGVAGFVNMAMLAMAAKQFHVTGLPINSITDAYKTLEPLLGPAAATIFGVSLLASGLSSSTVGTMAGQVVMAGFVDFTVPIWVRRVVTALPAFAAVLLGLNITHVLVISQVVLSFGIPLALIPLLIYTSDRRIMGAFANTRLTTWVGWAVAAVIIGLNFFIITQAVSGGLTG